LADTNFCWILRGIYGNLNYICISITVKTIATNGDYTRYYTDSLGTDYTKVYAYNTDGSREVTSTGDLYHHGMLSTNSSSLRAEDSTGVATSYSGTSYHNGQLATISMDGVDENGDANSVGTMSTTLGIDWVHLDGYTYSINEQQGIYGSLKLNEQAEWIYTLDSTDPDTTALAPGVSVTDSFSITLSDGSATTTQAINVNVTNSEFNIIKTFSEYRTPTTESAHMDYGGTFGKELLPGEGSYLYTSTNVYDGVNANADSYYFGERISYTRSREYDDGIVHTDVYTGVWEEGAHPTQSTIKQHTETNTQGVVILDILKVKDVDETTGVLSITKTFKYFDDNGDLIKKITETPVTDEALIAQSIDYVRTHYDANDVITGATYVMDMSRDGADNNYAREEKVESYYESLGADERTSDVSLYIPFSTDIYSPEIRYVEMDSDGNILSQSTGFQGDRHDNISSTVSVVDGVTTTTWTNNFGYQVVETASDGSTNQLTGTTTDDLLNGTAGVDNITTLEGADVVYALAGNDTINLSADSVWSSGYAALNVSNDASVGTNQKIDLAGLNRFSDVIDGGADVDTLNLTDGNDAFFIDDVYSAHHSSLSLASTTQGLDSIARILDLEIINAGEGNDIVDLTSTNFILAQAVEINGEAGNDVLWGSNGNDSINGGDGNDTINGGAGFDDLSGGTGADIFQFTATSGSDDILDFDITQDSIQLYYRAGDDHTNADLDLTNGVLTWDVLINDVDNVVIDLSATVSSSDLNDLDALISFVEIV